jgi:1-aminocyclopropane-1-carboxylate deaminase/D-cysteine desulfhydrase-like pyridoxal-dependent ACC family enzyme
MRASPFYVKRDDELGFGISGSKLRKYASLLPFLQKQRKKVALFGSPYSNHILSLVQLLKERGIPFIVFLERQSYLPKEGNFFLLSLLLSPEELVWVDRSFSQAEQEQIFGEEFFWVPMGGATLESLPGALTLAVDILENEKELDLLFDQIFIDAGTGMSAAALILSMAYLRKKVKVHGVLMAGTKEDFVERLFGLKKNLELLLQEEICLDHSMYELHFPPTAKSFGATNRSVFQKIQEVAKKEGFFIDPIYTAKLLLTLEEKPVFGNVLWIHSGGGLSLFGFKQQLL